MSAAGLYHPPPLRLLSVLDVFQQELKLLTHTFWSFQPFLAVWHGPALSDSNRVCVCCMGVLGQDVFLITPDERAKHDQQFLGLSPTAGGYITGNTLSFTSGNRKGAALG